MSIAHDAIGEGNDPVREFGLDRSLLHFLRNPEYEECKAANLKIHYSRVLVSELALLPDKHMGSCNQYKL